MYIVSIPHKKSDGIDLRILFHLVDNDIVEWFETFAQAVELVETHTIAILLEQV